MPTKPEPIENPELDATIALVMKHEGAPMKSGVTPNELFECVKYLRNRLTMVESVIRIALQPVAPPTVSGKFENLGDKK